MLWKFFLIFHFGFTSLAESAPHCTIESLSNNCKIFEKLPRIIKTSKNTFIINPLPDSRIQAPEFKRDLEKPKDIVEEDAEKSLDAKIELLEVLKSNSKISERFKIALSALMGDGIGFPLQVVDGKIVKRAPDRDKGEYAVTTVLTLPLPADDPKAKMKRIEPEELLDQLNKLGPEIQPSILKLAQLTSTKFSLTGFVTETLSTDQKANRYKEIQSMFEKSKLRIAAQLRLMGKQSGRISDFESLAIKVERIQSSEKYIPYNDLKECRSGPNAVYQSVSHTVGFCEGILRLPDAAILGTIGHEIGHALDPCFGCAGLHDVKTKKSVDGKLKYRFSIGSKPKYIDYGLTGMPLDFVLNEEQRAWASQQTEIIQISKPFNRSNYPLDIEADCLVDTNQLRRISESDIPEFVFKLAQDRKRTHGYMTSKSEMQEITKVLSQNPDCISGYGVSNNLNESIADMFGSMLQADHLKENPPKNEFEKLIPTALFLENHCRDKDPNEILSLSPPGSSGLAISNEMKYRSQENLFVHDANGNRINRSYLGHPEIAAALNCAPSAISKCYDRLLGPGGTTMTSTPINPPTFDRQKEVEIVPSKSGVQQ